MGTGSNLSDFADLLGLTDLLGSIVLAKYRLANYRLLKSLHLVATEASMSQQLLFDLRPK